MIEETQSMTYTFAPNWYKSQCVCFCGENMIYASNYLLYSYNLEERKVVKDICLRKALLEKGIKFKDIKIQIILLLDKETLLVGLNSNYLVFLSQTFNVLSIQKLEQLECVQYAFYMKKQETVILQSENGTLFSGKFNGSENCLEDIQCIKQSKGHKKLKNIFSVSPYILIFCSNGLVSCLQQSSLKQICSIHLEEHILSADVDVEDKQIVIITKSKNNSIFLYHSIFSLQQMEEMGKQMKKVEYRIIYPKSFYEKIKNHQKSALSVKILNNIFIASGKMGELFSINPQLLKNNEIVAIKPHSIEDVPDCLEIWDDSKHYKEIYSIYAYKNHLYFNSTDQNMSIWEIREAKPPKHKYSIKFLTSSVQSIFFCESDAKVMFLLLKDSIIRSSVPLGQGAYYLNEYWKFTKKFKISKAVCHPTQLGIKGLITECNKVIVYDVYVDRMMKIIEFGKEDIINISFEQQAILEGIEKISEEEGKWEEEKVKVTSHFKKQVDDEIILLVQLRKKFVSIGEEKVLSFPKKHKIERIHNTKNYRNGMMLSTKKQKMVLFMRVLFEGLVGELQLKLKYENGRHIFKHKKNAQHIYLIQYKGKKVTVSKIGFTQQEKSLKVWIVQENEIHLQLSSDECTIDYWSGRVAFYNQKDDLLQIVDVEDVLLGKVHEQCYQYNSRIEALSFYLEDNLIIGSKDQTVKVLKIKDLGKWKSEVKKQKTL